MVRRSTDTATKRTPWQYFAPATCPNCGGIVLAAEASEYVSDGHVRNRWLCDDCDLGFRTVIKISG
jgi:hypothetical protein